MFKIKNAKFITSALNITKAPPDSCYPEVAVMGRSNVGKSSLLCSLTNNRKLAKVSQTPGKTRLINYFLVDDAWYLVDLPGYGFAKVSKAEQERWSRSMEEYLAERRGIVLAVLLIDIRHDPKASDLQMLEWLRQRSYPVCVVLTKADKLSRSQMANNVRRCAKLLNCSADELFPYSSANGYGREQLMAFLGEILAEASVPLTP
ncbi:YihA family ribosome biogenesis GTP-binding protein [bacterium]|nr:YihA family ribosome biogenesis GTP-binding protein [bacterium]